MKSNSTPLSLVSKSNIITALAFGATAMLIVKSGLLIPIYGETIHADPREIFITLGSAFTGPIGGIIIGFMGQTWGAGFDFQTISFIVHSTGGVWMGFAYKKLVHEKLKYPMQLLGWLGLTVVYYFIFLFLGFATWTFLFFPQIRTEIFGDLTLQQAYLALVQAAYPEFIVTALITTIILVILPPKYRQPLW